MQNEGSLDCILAALNPTAACCGRICKAYSSGIGLAEWVLSLGGKDKNGFGNLATGDVCIGARGDGPVFSIFSWLRKDMRFQS